MQRSPRERSIYVAAILFAAAPLAFGLIRAVETGTDFRYLWVAIASFIGALVLMAIGKPRGQTPSPIPALPAIVFVVTTLIAAATAFLLGARSAPAVLAVASAFGLCWTASCALYARSRPRTI